LPTGVFLVLRHPLSIKDLLNKRLCSSFKSLDWLRDEIVSRRNVTTITTITTVTNVIGGLMRNRVKLTRKLIEKINTPGFTWDAVIPASISPLESI